MINEPTDTRQLPPRPMLNDRDEGQDVLNFLVDHGKYEVLTTVILKTFDSDIAFKQRLTPIEHVLVDYINRHAIKNLNINFVIIHNTYTDEKFLISPKLMPIHPHFTTYSFCYKLPSNCNP